MSDEEILSDDDQTNTRKAQARRGIVGLAAREDDASSVGAEELQNFKQIFRAIYGGRRAQKYKHIMKFIPWCIFLLPGLEQAYVRSRLYSFRFRVPLAGGAQICLTMLLWVIYGSLLDAGLLYVTPPLFVSLVHVLSSVCLLTSLAVAYANYFTFGRKHPETWYHLFSWQLYVFWMLWVLAVFLNGFLRRHDSSNDMTFLQSMQFKFWTDTTLIFLIFTNMCLMDQVFLSRTWISLYFHVIPAVLFVLTKVMTSVTFNDVITKKPIPGVILNQVFQMVFIIVFIIQSYLGRLNNEGLERISFYKVLANQRKIVAVRKAQDTKKIAGGQTAIENLTLSLKKAQTAIEAATLKYAQDDLSLIDQDEVLRQCVETTLDTDDLFAIGNPQDSIGDDEDVNFVKIFQIIHEGRIEKLPGNGPIGTTGDDVIELGEENEPEYFTPTILCDEIDNPIPCGHAGEDPDLDLLQLSKSKSDILIGIGMDILEPQLPYMNVSADCLNKYLYLVQARYFTNPYHNAIHGAMVAHMSMLITKCLDLRNRMCKYDLVALPIAALGHDVGHPGKNNNYMSTTGTLMARMYSDHAVLENFHGYLTFRLAVIGPEVNIFQNLSEEDYRWIRQRIIAFILATDMAFHFEKISKFRLRKESPKYDITNNIEDFQNLLRLCIKMADLSHSIETWPTHLEWSLRIQQEFYAQGDKESELGLPISPLCDRSRHDEFSKSQTGFLTYVVLPLATELLSEDVTGQFESVLMARLVYNKHKWKIMKDLQQPEIPPDVSKIRSAPPHYSESLFIHSLFCRSVAQLATDDPLEDVRVRRLFSRHRIGEVFEPHKSLTDLVIEEMGISPSNISPPSLKSPPRPPDQSKRPAQIKMQAPSDSAASQPTKTTLPAKKMMTNYRFAKTPPALAVKPDVTIKKSITPQPIPTSSKEPPRKSPITEKRSSLQSEDIPKNVKPTQPKMSKGEPKSVGKIIVDTQKQPPKTAKFPQKSAKVPHKPVHTPSEITKNPHKPAQIRQKPAQKSVKTAQMRPKPAYLSHNPTSKTTPKQGHLVSKRPSSTTREPGVINPGSEADSGSSSTTPAQSIRPSMAKVKKSVPPKRMVKKPAGKGTTDSEWTDVDVR